MKIKLNSNTSQDGQVSWGKMRELNLKNKRKIRRGEKSEITDPIKE